MLNNIILTVLCVLIFNGCTSRSELNKSAENHAKAGDYYESIGQPDAAKRSRDMAQKDRDDADDVEAILSDIFFGKDKK